MKTLRTTIGYILAVPITLFLIAQLIFMSAAFILAYSFSFFLHEEPNFDQH